MISLLVAQLALAAALPALGRWIGPRVFWVAAVGPAVAFGWLLAVLGDVVGGDERRDSWAWAPELGLRVALRLDGLALLLALLATGVGAVVLCYSRHYFADRDGASAGRVATVLSVFATAMLLLVLADNVLVLYVAWELTTLCSFLLIGDDGSAAANRRAALRALLVTTGAGFAMLLGLVLLAEQAGTYQLSAIVADPPRGALAATAVVLVLVGALAKCAQVPFHPWLPDAMAAPTPVSAYLHAAAMVKAGCYLVARLAPGFADAAPWTPIVLTVGVATMVLGGWRALAQTDLKRLLAFGTVAQLGFLVVLLGAGTRTAALAGAAMLLAHALFKGTLFLVVGVVDHATGTRDMRELRGIGRRSPALVAIALLASASMVGLPPFVGYLGKEAAFEALLEPGPGHTAALVGIVLGSVLTVAYTLRFLRGCFGSLGADAASGPGPWEPPAPGFVLAPALLALTGLAGLAPTAVDSLAASYADTLGGSASYHLALWHGLKAPLWLSVLTLAAGVAVHLLRGRLAAVHGRLAGPVRALEAQDVLARGVVAAATRVEAMHDRALPIHLARTALVVAVLPLAPLVLLGAPDGIRPWDSPAQAVVALGTAACCAALLGLRHRLAAVVVLSAAGYLVAGLFVLYGAPDLALVQLLVETLAFVAFVLVIRRMPAALPAEPRRGLPLRTTASIAMGSTAALTTLAVGERHAPSRVSEEYFRMAPEHGGPNVVNIIITDFRALDTLGETTVLVIAATAVASLVLAGTRMGGPPVPGRSRRGPDGSADATDGTSDDDREAVPGER